MIAEPKMEHASRPGIKSGLVLIAVAAGIATIFYWPQIKVMFDLS
jgi:hypothetical protein